MLVVLARAHFVLRVCCEDVLASGFDGGGVFESKEVAQDVGDILYSFVVLIARIVFLMVSLVSFWSVCHHLVLNCVFVRFAWSMHWWSAHLQACWVA